MLNVLSVLDGDGEGEAHRHGRVKEGGIRKEGNERRVGVIHSFGENKDDGNNWSLDDKLFLTYLGG